MKRRIITESDEAPKTGTTMLNPPLTLKCTLGGGLLQPMMGNEESPSRSQHEYHHPSQPSIDGPSRRGSIHESSTGPNRQLPFAARTIPPSPTSLNFPSPSAGSYGHFPTSQLTRAIKSPINHHQGAICHLSDLHIRPTPSKLIPQPFSMKYLFRKLPYHPSKASMISSSLPFPGLRLAPVRLRRSTPCPIARSSACRKRKCDCKPKSSSWSVMSKSYRGREMNVDKLQ
jgi:hypothetical protein